MDNFISAEQVISGQNKLAFPRGCGHDLYWMECLADEGNRWVVRCCNVAAQQVQTLTPDGCAVSSKVHEYGGIAYGVAAYDMVWINKSDQSVHRYHAGQNILLYQHKDWVFGEPLVCDAGVVLVAEQAQETGLPKNMLVFIDWQGELEILYSAADFVAAPALSPDGSRLVWMAWDMPSMPWQQGRIVCANWDGRRCIKQPQTVFDQQNVAVFQPCFTPEGQLYAVQDGSGFGVITQLENQDVLATTECEYGLPLWQLGMWTYSPLGKGIFVAARAIAGQWQLVVHDGAHMHTFATDGAHVSDPVAVGSGFAALIAPPDAPIQLRYWADVASDSSVLLHAAAESIPVTSISTPESLWFDGCAGRVQGYFYRPEPKENAALPPVIIKSHGGPSGQTDPSLNVKHQFWLSRGFAIFDVNYSGSTGFGRDYLNRLQGQWGLLDATDCLDGLQFLIESGRVHPQKAFISGSSAGGLTTLNCLCNSDAFAGGVCAYGVADLEGLAAITHKFEAKYLDGLVGVLPTDSDLYQSRSPLYHAEKITSPVLFLQGRQDVIVPPSQTEAMITAIESQPNSPKVSVLYFDHEGHGFRNTENVQRALEAEAEFYAQILNNQHTVEG